MAGWEKEIEELKHLSRRTIIKCVATYDFGSAKWEFKTYEYPIRKVSGRMLHYGEFGCIKVDAMRKVMRRGYFKYEIYTTSGQEPRDLAKLKKVSKL